MFQSTRPRGARLVIGAHIFLSLCVSIHAPTRGATWHRRPFIHARVVSIHAPTRGATVNLWCQVFHGLRNIIREPFRMPQNNSRKPDNEKINSLFSMLLDRSRTFRNFWYSKTFAIYKISGPSRSRGSFTPSCSTLPCQFDPRK